MPLKNTPQNREFIESMEAWNADMSIDEYRRSGNYIPQPKKGELITNNSVVAQYLAAIIKEES